LGTVAQLTRFGLQTPIRTSAKTILDFEVSSFSSFSRPSCRASEDTRAAEGQAADAYLLEPLDLIQPRNAACVFGNVSTTRSIMIEWIESQRMMRDAVR